MLPSEINILAKISAGMTHEMKNVLATIKESSGLIQDLFTAYNHTLGPHQDKLQRAMSSVKAQVERGARIMTLFNRFAHSMDHNRAEVELEEFGRLVVVLMERFARLKNVGLEARPPAGPLTLNTNPWRLILLLCTCLDHLLELAPPGGQVELGLEQREEKAAIELIINPEPQKGPLMPSSDLEPALSELKAQLGPLEQSGQKGLLLLIPLK